MDFGTELISSCRHGLESVAGLPRGLAASLFFAGVAGSLVHCAGMCGPFVLGQVMSDAERCPAGAYGEWRRLAGASLAPYHLGRLTTYTALGAIGGTATALFASTAMFAWLSAALLLVAASLMVLQAFGLAVAARSPLAPALTRLAGPLASSPSPIARYGLGVFAMKIRGFAQQFRGAELDMYFSLKGDLVTFKDFLHTLKEEGQKKMASLLERGTL